MALMSDTASAATTAPFAPGTTADTGAAPAAHRERHGVWLMVGGGLLLGTLGVFVEEAHQDPLTTVWFRCAFGAMALLIWGAFTRRLGELRLSRAGALAAIATGLLMILNWALFFAAIERTSIAVATVVFHVQPLWVIALGAWWLRETVTKRQVAAACVALAGLALSTGLLDTGFRLAPVDARFLWGVAMCLGGSLSYAAVTLIAKCVRGVGSYALACWQCGVGALALAWWPSVHGWPQDAAAWGWLAGLGAIHTGLAYVVLYAGMARLPAARIAVLQFVYPVAAVLVDWLVYGRALSPVQIAGVAAMGLALRWTKSA
jgi:drug/metabolite transporter (DMT)-like permease